MTEPNHIGQLKPDPQNARRHNQRNIGQIVSSLQEVGAARSIVIDEDNIILAGNGVIEAAGIAGIENVRVIEADGNEIIAVKRKGLTPEQKTRLALWDNRAAELAEWDVDQLQINFDSGMLDGMFSDIDLEKLGLNTKGEQMEDVEPQIDKAEELRVKWGVESGQLWQLGEHRLVCGDCADRTVVEKVMGGEKADMVFTDPPYGMNKDFVNDNLKDMIEFHKKWIVICKQYSDVMLCWYDPKRIREIIIPADELFSKMTDYLHMYKPNDVAFPLHSWIRISESMLIFGKGKYIEVNPYAHDTYLYNHEDKDKSFYHPSVKPINIVSDVISRFDADIIYDPFLGSGTTLIACERLNRKCRAVEISPAYCAVAIQRWVDVTGQEPVILE